MGAWGTGLFSDDTACDIRDSYKEHLGNGLSGPEATSRVLLEFKSSLADPDEFSIVWLALAAAQWNTGRLEPETLEQALRVIDSGTDLTRWSANPVDRKKRRAVLEKLKSQLQSPQPPEKRVRKEHKEACDWLPGNLIAYRLLSRNLVIFRVVSLHTDKGGTSPVCELLDWSGPEIPSPAELSALPARQSLPTLRYRVQMLILFRRKKATDLRIRLLDFQLPAPPAKANGAAVFWKELDIKLKMWFDLE
jgi:hypothetical protein